ncbi:heme lyase CcmF/NrfE family subunit [Vibrio neonatus]|uniref:heme lyase CcmF/NrfE family subunit n=1 Tax=Vibrio neonatus TaxID=278860 RepID=UPI0021C47DEB|nr:heme lyase NrfEFG subunit NrfE [Vibrio neonatus]
MSETMLANLGLFCLILTAIVSSAGVGVGLYTVAQWRVFQTDKTGQANYLSGNSSPQHRLMWAPSLVRSFALISFLASTISISLLAYAFASDDFSLSYVSNNSNSALALPFKIAATWGGHQGSMLFWILVLAGWAVLVSRRHTKESDYHASWLMLLLVAIFSWFTLIASNPFVLNEVLPLQGRDLNPMLQDIGLIIHPPLLYIGYVGFASVLALTCGYLLALDNLGDVFERLTRHALLAWIFLSAGILVGAAWAYYELGWGGWWFWDPVENASLLPWLTATALLHSVMVSRKQGQLKVFTFVLAIVTFCLSILGTFIVRSGVLTSVHAFAVDPSKGLALLAILSLVFISAYGLLVARVHYVKSNAITRFASKNFLILVSINLLVLATAIVLLGTFYPMLYQLFGLGNISVGAPYFNLLFGPLTILALIVMGFSPLVKWQAQSGAFPVKFMLGSLILCGVLSVLFLQMYIHRNSHVSASWSAWALLTTWVAMWMSFTHIARCFRVRKQVYKYKVYLVSMAHIGVAILAFGASMNSFYSYELTAKLGPNSHVQFGDYQIHYQNTKLYIASNYTAEQGVVEITAPNGQTHIALPEKRYYSVRVMNMTEPSLTPFLDGDVYLTLGEKLDTQHYAVRMQFKAFIRWILLGAVLTIIAGVGLLGRGVLVKQWFTQPKVAKEYQA